MGKDEKMVELYKELGMNMRLFVNYRFAHLTLYFAISGLLILNLFEMKSGQGVEGIPMWLIPAAGLLSTLIFFAIEVSGNQHFFHNQTLAGKLEEKIGVELKIKKLNEDENRIKEISEDIIEVNGPYSLKRNDNSMVFDDRPTRYNWRAEITTATIAVEILFRAIGIFWLYLFFNAVFEIELLDIVN